MLEESVSWIDSGAKKTNIRVTMSSVSEIPRDLADRYNIATVPLRVKTEGGCFRDGIDMDADAILSYVAGKKKKASLSPISAPEFEKFFSEILKTSNNIIHISASGKIYDTSIHGALEATEKLNNVSVVDSEQISAGQGILAIEASRMAEEGKRLDEILERLQQIKGRIRTAFLVENVDSMVDSHQINSSFAKMLKAFLIRPILVMKNGRIKTGGMRLGSRDRACKSFISYALRNRSYIDKRMLFISHVGLTKNELDQVRSEVEKYVHFDEVYVTKASPAIAINVGVGTFGLIFMMKE